MCNAARSGPIVKHKTLLIATTILLVAFGLRAAGIIDVPPGLSGDEGINGADALNVWRWGTTPIFFTNNYGREAGFIYMIALSIKLYGANTLAIRLPAIVTGTASILMTFVFLHRLWNLRVAAIATALMSISFWPIFVSRIGLRAVSMLPLEVLALYSLWRGLQRGRLRWWLALGISLGLIQYAYIPGRVFPLVIISWLLSMSLFTPQDQRPQISTHIPALLLATVIALLIFAPYGRFMVQYPDQANQRMQELSGVLASLKAGDLEPLLESTVRTLGMFTFVGDPYWRYGIENRPVFDWVTGLVFYAGVVLCTVHIRRPRNQLLLIWLAVMLTPSMFSSGAPSFLRAAGAIIPVYTLPAVALDAVSQWLGQRRAAGKAPRHSFQRWYAGALALGLVVVGIRDGIAYFVTWPNTPRVREVYTAGLAQVGRQLSVLDLAAEGENVFVGCDFASDYARDMVRFQTSYTGPIHWFVGRRALVFPANPNPATEAYYFLADAMPPASLAGSALSRAEPLYVSQSSNGAFESAGYRIPQAAQATSPWQPDIMLTGRFEEAMELIGYSLPDEVERGGHANLLVYWRIPETYTVDHTTPLWFQLDLVDAQGNLWDARSNLLPYANWDWQPGDVVGQSISSPVAEDVPPGELTMNFSIEKAQSPLPFTMPGRSPILAVPMGPLTVTGTPVTEVPQDAIPLGSQGEVLLDEAVIIGVALPGDRLHTTLYWYTQAATEMDYAARLQIRTSDCSGEVIHTEMLPLWPDRYPTSRWQPGERVRSFHHPALPRELAIGNYGITIDLVTANAATPTTDMAGGPASAACYPLEITGHVRQYGIPAMDVRLDRALSDGVGLLGYSLVPPLGEITPGSTVELTLYWQATSEPTRAYTIFTHIYGPDGTLVSQHDGQPCSGGCPTSSWVTDEIVSDSHTLLIPPHTAPGKHTFGVGMYDAGTAVRLRVPDAENDAIEFPGPEIP